MKIYQIIALWYIIATSFVICWCLPVLDTNSGIDNETIEELRANFNDTPKNL